MHSKAPPHPRPASELIAPCNSSRVLLAWQRCTALTFDRALSSPRAACPQSQLSATVSYQILFRLSTSFAYAIVPLRHGRLT